MLDYILSVDNTFQDTSLIIDIDGIIPQTDSSENNFLSTGSAVKQRAGASGTTSTTSTTGTTGTTKEPPAHGSKGAPPVKTPLFAGNPIELRLLFEINLRDRSDCYSQLPYLIVYRHADSTLPYLPYDIEKKCRCRSLTLASLFPMLHVDVIRNLSSRGYRLLLEKTKLTTQPSQPLDKKETAAFVIQTIYGTDITGMREKEELVRFLIDLHVSEEPLSPSLVDYLLSTLGEGFYPRDQLGELLGDATRFFNWLSSRLEEFLHALPGDALPANALPAHELPVDALPGRGAASDNYINFSHPDLSMKTYHLIANSHMPLPELPEQLLDIELAPEDQWVFLIYPHDTQFTQTKDPHTPIDPKATPVDPEVAAHLEKLKNLADEDQELFLMKTRKTMESIVNDLLHSTAQDVSYYTLFEKLNYLEEHNLLPKTTATFFHTIRKLGNLGAHEAKGIHLTSSEIDTILSMLSYVLQWHKN